MTLGQETTGDQAKSDAFSPFQRALTRPSVRADALSGLPDSENAWMLKQLKLQAGTVHKNI